MIRKIFASTIVALSLVHSVSAADRALIIGVGDFQDPRISDLPGIDLDVGIMERVALQMGFAKKNTRVLQNEQATAENVYNSLTKWVAQDVAADDRILIYLSSHGSQSRDDDGDEADNLDEFLVLHDTTFQEGGPISNVLDDDSFFEILSALPSKNVMLIVDACNSGTGYKSFTGALTGGTGHVSKTFPIPGHATSSSERFTAEKSASSSRFIAFMAAADNQSAIATPRGSVFTLGIERLIGQAISSGSTMTPRQMTADLREFVKSELSHSPQSVFTPQLGGSADLIDKPLRLVASNSVREELESSIARVKPLKISTNHHSYPLGDKSLRVSVDVPVAGYLNIVTVDQTGKAVVLFPNQFNADNRVGSGSVSIPTPQMNFDLTAMGPLGEHYIAALWTSTALNLFDSGWGNRDEKGVLTDVFAGLSMAGSRAFEATIKDQSTSVLGGQVTVNMVR